MFNLPGLEFIWVDLSGRTSIFGRWCIKNSYLESGVDRPVEGLPSPLGEEGCGFSSHKQENP